MSGICAPVRAYLSFFRMRFLNGLQYRAAAAAGICTQFFWGGMEILAYRAFYAADPSAFPMTMAQLSTYIWLQQAFLALYALWSMDNTLFEVISDGNVAYELTRPLDLYSMWFTKNLAMRLARAVLRCLPILVFAALLPAPYGLTLPVSGGAFVLFLFTMLLALVLVVAVGMLCYIATFRTISSRGVRMMVAAAGDFLTGALVPLPFMPEWLQRVIGLTPFAAMQNLPFRIYSGSIVGEELWHAVALQIVWVTVLLLLGHWLMTRALRHVVVQGG